MECKQNNNNNNNNKEVPWPIIASRIEEINRHTLDLNYLNPQLTTMLKAYRYFNDRQCLYDLEII